MYVNTAPVCRYKFLLEKPVLYTRPISLKENIVTNVKFLTISHNKTYNNYVVRLYGANEMVDWDEVLTKKDDSNLIYDDTFLLENTKLERFLRKFGL